MFNYAHIGSFCSIADRVHIGGSAHPIDFVSTSPVFLSHSRTSVKKKFHDHIFLPKKITTIGNDVWIGSGVFIKGGLKIGNGAIIGMGSVVTKDVPDYAIVAGNPAKIIRMRFPDHLINKMLELKWWDWDDSKLLEYGKYFNNPIDLINKVSKK
jgi:acetyltransferase-like isoleucine patch superfamily enzyme